ncbi:hypothetical protein MKX01_018844 [Papaver californicum]|nr:hypothetical protein MKX01_018844 [Papaver californicum]
MASLKRFYLIAFIFGFILVSLFANAARTSGLILDIPSTCTHNEECTDQCDKQSFHKGGFCLPNPLDPLGPFRCCCYD